MTNQIIVQQDNLEVRTNRLQMHFQTFDRGPSRYAFGPVNHLEVDVVENGRKRSETLLYDGQIIIGPDNIALARLIHETDFIPQLNGLFGGRYSEIDDAVDDYIGGKPSDKEDITIEEGTSLNERYPYDLYIDLSK